MASASSSSTLSPLAAPFTVDRPSITHRLQPYSCFPPPLLDDPSPRQFDGDDAMPAVSFTDSSSWIDPSLHYSVSPFQKGSAADSFVTYGDPYGGWHRNHFDSSANLLHMGSDSSAWGVDSHPDIYETKPRDSHDYELSYFHLPDPNTITDECNTSNSNSSYDRYMSQLVSCSTNPSDQLYYPTTCSSSPHLYNPAMPENRNLIYNVDDDYVDHMMSKKKESFLNQYCDGKQGYVKGNIADSIVNGSVESLISQVGSSFGHEVANGDSVDCSARLKYGLRTEKVKFDLNASSSMSNSSTQLSREIVDQPNPVVDSPCWRGANLSRQYSFLGHKMVDHYPLEKELEGSNDLDQEQNHISINARYWSPSHCQEKDGGLTCHHNLMESSSFPGNFTSNNHSSKTDEKPHINAKGSDFVEVAEEEESKFPFIGNGKIAEAVKSPENDSERTDKNVKQIVQEGTSAVFSSQLIDDKLSDLNLDDSNYAMKLGISGSFLGQVVKPVDAGDHAAKNLESEIDVRKLVKAMHGLSEVLLSSSFLGVELRKCDHEIAQQVISNLETFLCKNNKIPPQEHETGQFQVSVSKSDDNINKQNPNLQSVCSCTNGDDFDLRSYNATAEVIKDNPLEMNKENPQVALYKNLWMQAEASLCSMKYELQIAHLKLEMTKAKSLGGKPQEEKPNKDNEVDSSIMSRLEVLKAPFYKSNNASMGDHPKCSETGNTLKELPARFADLGFVDSGILKPFNEEACRDAESSVVKAMPAGMQHVAPNYSEKYEHACGGVSLVGTVVDPFSQPFMTSTSMSSQTNPLRFVLW